MAVVTWTKAVLSGSTHGRPIKVAQAATPGTTIHTAGAGTTDDNMDEVWLWCTNTDVVERQLTLEWGGTTAPDDNLLFRIPPKTTYKVAAGWVLRNALLVKAFADAANVLVLQGHVNQIRSA